MTPISRTSLIGIVSIVIGGSLFYILFQNGYVQPLPPTRLRGDILIEHKERHAKNGKSKEVSAQNAEDLSTLPFHDVPSEEKVSDDSAWNAFTARLSAFSSFADSFADIKWASVSDTITDYIVPDWAKVLPGYIEKLQLELSMAPGSLADEIWQEAHDPYLNPEIEQLATVRISNDLCDDEKEFLKQRRKATTAALAKYLGLPEEEVDPNDVPCIAIVGSGGGLRACVASAGSLLATVECGLFDCVTYTAGVSGSCWLQALYHSSSLGNHNLDRVVDHLKTRLSTHIAYPPAFLSALNSAPTNKFLLRGFVEKLKGDSQAEFGLVDIYGVLLAARLLVPKGELGVNDEDLKLSNQRHCLKRGQLPLPLYTAVRHEIPIAEEVPQEQKTTDSSSEGAKEKAKVIYFISSKGSIFVNYISQQESWFQWFEITPFELFCEEFGSGIPTWAVGRKFKDGHDLPLEDGTRVPEIRLPLLLGIFGSAFCATLNHYYKEIRPLVEGLAGFGGIDEMIQGRNDDLSKVHPIDPASIPNPFYSMEGKLPDTTPTSVTKDQHIQLMDAGMSNNLPVYPLLRPGRNVDIIIAFDASADIKTENWLSVADGYALQRGIKGWPIGAGWPKDTDTPEQTAEQLNEAQAATTAEAADKVQEAKAERREGCDERSSDKKEASKITGQSQYYHQPSTGDLGYCTVWVGTTEKREHTDTSIPPQSKAAAEDWELMEPDAGIAVVYFPFLSNPKVEGVDPVTSPFMSTWNFIYTPQQVDSVVALAKANFEEGRERTRKTVRAVYERKKRLREERENAERLERWRRKVRLGIVGKKGEGDHFS
jgi:phospholipase A2